MEVYCNALKTKQKQNRHHRHPIIFLWDTKGAWPGMIDSPESHSCWSSQSGQAHLYTDGQTDPDRLIPQTKNQRSSGQWKQRGQSERSDAIGYWGKRASLGDGKRLYRQEELSRCYKILFYVSHQSKYFMQFLLFIDIFSSSFVCIISQCQFSTFSQCL